MVFTAVEILALILSVIVLLKLIILTIKPDVLFNLSKKWFNNVKLFQVSILIFGGVMLYYLLQTLTIVQIFAVTLFVAALYALLLAPYAKKLMKFFKPKTIVKDNWLAFLIWVVLALWVLKELFM